MDHNSCSMKKLGYNAKDYKRPKCSFYVRYCLLCTSIIQLLIILGLVLFMVYGNKHSSQQSHFKSTHNQSLQFMEDIKKLQSYQRVQTRDLKICQNTKVNLTKSLDKVSKNLQTCIKPKNATNVPNYQAAGNANGVKHGMMPTNYSMVLNELSKLRDDQQLREARQKLDETRLSSQKRELLKQIQDVKGNCTSMSRDFQSAMVKVQASYEAGFRSLTGGVGYPYNSGLGGQLQRIKANCTPLSLGFQAEVQRKLVQLDTDIRRMWQQNGEQKLRADALQRMNDQCKQEAQARAEQFSKRELKQQADTEKLLEDKVALLLERNSLRGQLVTLRVTNPHLNVPMKQGSTKPAPSTCRQQADLISQLYLILDVKDRILYEKDEAAETLKRQLKAQVNNCTFQMEKQKAMACRASG